MLADVLQVPAGGGILAWLLVGLIAGWLTGLFMGGSGYGIIMDIIVGLLGSFIGGLVFSMFVDGVAGFWGSIGIAFVGGVILVAIVRALSPRATV
jgi:uncharacterized membrane protein YeaQ/YmgE (transglycosylase-associated protein family)